MNAPRRLVLLAGAAALSAQLAAAQAPPAPAATPPPAPPVEPALRSAVSLGATDAPLEAAAPKVGKSTLRLAEAVQLTILHDPRVLTERQEVAFSSGQVREANGRFDQFVTAAPSYSRSMSELTNYVRGQQDGNRELIRRLGEEFSKASTAVQEQLAKNDVEPPQCPEGLTFVNLSELESSDITDRTALLFEDTIVVLPQDLTRGQDRYFALCSPPSDLGARPESTLNLVRSINDAARLGLGDELLTLTQLPRETLTVMSDITQEVATKAKLALVRLGASPVDEVSSTLAFKGGWGKLFKNGLLFRTEFRFQGSEHNFVGKSLDPAFGGFGLRNDFPSYLTFSLDMPLGRNRGAVSTAAPLRASEFSLLAERETLRETVSEEVFGTVLAYVALQSAQQQLAWLEQSAARQRRLADLSRQLVDGGELASAELDRVRARAALVESQVSGARTALVQARLTLAQAIGVSVDALEDAPLAADALPTALVDAPPAPVLVERALANRRELRAASHLQSAAEVLARAARSDLKRRFDFNVTGGFNTLYESPLLRLFPAEQDVQPYPQGLRFTDPTGLWRSVERRWRPTISAQLVFELPTRNSAAHGRLAQEEASFQTSRVQRSEAERVVRSGVVEAAGTVRRAREALLRHREALSFYEKSLEAAMSRFEAGDITLLDTLVTEEDLTRQRLQLVAASQEYLSRLARLRYETGELVTFVDDNGPQERVEFDASPFVAP